MKDLVDDKLLENILIESSKKRNIQKVKERQSKRIVDQGDNYASLTWQEIVKVANEKDAVWEKRLVIKTVPHGEQARRYIETVGLFNKEIKMYTEVLPKMEKLLKNHEQYGERLWPKFVGMRPYNTIILEDLTSKGFQKVDRRKGLDLEHALFAIKALAKFHTLSVALKDELLLCSKEFIKFDQSKDNNAKTEFFKSKIKSLVKIMRKEWESKWQKLACHLENDDDKIINRFTEICQRKENNFNVLNHGDPWTSNLLFKYSEFSGNVCAIRFVDFQMRHFGSFAIDLQYLLNTSVQANVIKNHKNELLAAYHATLLTTARKLTLTDVVIPSLNVIKTEMNDKILVGLVMAILLLDMMLVDPDEAPDLQSILQHKYNNEKILSSTLYREKMQSVLEPYIHSDFSTL